jgi:hypothetical protein
MQEIGIRRTNVGRKTVSNSGVEFIDERPELIFRSTNGKFGSLGRKSSKGLDGRITSCRVETALGGCSIHTI